jgi:hypothetical protein
MARVRDIVRWLTGPVGYAAYPRPDVTRPANRLAEARNVWMGGTSGFATRRGGMALLKTLTGDVAYMCTAAAAVNEEVYPLIAINVGGVLQTSTPGWGTEWVDWSGALTFGAFTHAVSLRNKVFFGGTTTDPVVLDVSAGAYETPAAPTAVDTGSGAYATTLRYYRVQWRSAADYALSGPVSAALSFTPSGAGNGVVVTRPALPTGSVPTLWRLWGSTDDETYFLLAETLADTETVTDTTAPGAYPPTTVLRSTATALRLAGVLQASGTAAVDSGTGTYATTVRYYRTRFIERIAAVTVRRGEPSDTVTFTPSGTGDSVRLSQPTNDPGNAGITHWEVEASADNANFYRIDTKRMDEAYYYDSADPTTYVSGTLSEDIGAYEAPPRTRAIGVDRDRVLFAGGITEHFSRVWYTPVLGTTDVSDEERVPTDNYLDIEASDDDHITAVIGPVANAMLVFKRRSFFRLVRTGDVAAPYEVVKVAEGVGVEAMSDLCLAPGAARAEAIYFVNRHGAWRYDGDTGLERLNGDLAPVWQDETTPSTMRRVVYYPTRDVVLFGAYAYHLATGGWSYLAWGGGNPALQVVCRFAGDTATSRLVMPSAGATDDGVYQADDMNALTAGTDVDSAPFVARVRTNRVTLVEPTLRWRPTRLRVWGSGSSLICKTYVGSDDTPYTVSPFYLGAAAEESDISRVFRPGPVEWLGLSFEDDGSADAAWSLDAVELTGLPQESVP